MDHKDIAGQSIKPGAFVIYAALWDRCATLKYGIVTKLRIRPDITLPPKGGYPQGRPTIRVLSVDRSTRHHQGTWTVYWELQKEGKEMALGFLDRLLVVPENVVPDEALKLLKDAYQTYTRKK